MTSTARNECSYWRYLWTTENILNSMVWSFLKSSIMNNESICMWVITLEISDNY